MNSGLTLKLTNEFAPGYDNYISNKEWSGPEIIFKLLQSFINKGDLLLDLGIGTGLASIAFKNAGLKIYGIDGSSEMIRLCSQKNIAENIFLSDIASEHIQFPDIEFDFIVSNAVFHMVGNLNQIFTQVKSHLKPNGFFCFTTFPFNESVHFDFSETEVSGIFSKSNTENEPKVYRHTHQYIYKSLAENDLRVIMNEVFVGFNDKAENNEIVFDVFLTQKIS